MFWFIVIGFILVVGALIALLGYYLPLTLYLEARSSGVSISLWEMGMMSVQRIPHAPIINALIMTQKAGLDLTVEQLQGHYQAGGNVPLVAKALVAAHKANIGLDFKLASRIDLAGKNVLEAVQTVVSPKVVNMHEVVALPKDGIQVIVKAKITIRTRIESIIGGAGEDTIIAKVGEGIFSEIGKVATHQIAIEDPVTIADAVEILGLDEGTAYQIVSVDITEMNIGKNVGVVVKIEQANADKNIAQAEAEKRRSMAIAEEQEARARLVESETRIPLAIAEAFRNGNMSVMDFYQYRNIKADTEMREALSKTSMEPSVKVQETVEEIDQEIENNKKV